MQRLNSKMQNHIAKFKMNGGAKFLAQRETVIHFF